MVLLAFLIDTSASMNQRTCLGTSYLDLAKGAVESFIKVSTQKKLFQVVDKSFKFVGFSFSAV